MVSFGVSFFLGHSGGRCSGSTESVRRDPVAGGRVQRRRRRKDEAQGKSVVRTPLGFRHAVRSCRSRRSSDCPRSRAACPAFVGGGSSCHRTLASSTAASAASACGSAGVATAVISTARESVPAVRDDTPLVEPSGGIDVEKRVVAQTPVDSVITIVAVDSAKKT